MENKPRCQSCAMPLGVFQGRDNYGTEMDSSKSGEYCMFCYQKGKFTRPTLTVQEMVATSIDFMTKNLHFTKEKAEELSNMYIPSLKRWKK